MDSSEVIIGIHSSPHRPSKAAELKGPQRRNVNILIFSFDRQEHEGHL